MSDVRRKNFYKIICVILFIVFVALLAFRIGDPWKYRHDDNGKHYTKVARAHNVLGFKETRGQEFTYNDITGNKAPYLHHPPLVGLFLAAVCSFTGEYTPVVVRTAMAGVHILSFLIFLAVVKEIFGEDIVGKVWAVMVFAIAPMSVFSEKCLIMNL